MTALDTALTSINAAMGDVGGLQNQLGYTINNLTTSIQNYTSSASTIEDVDMASEVSNLTKNQILQQSVNGDACAGQLRAAERTQTAPDV